MNNNSSLHRALEGLPLHAHGCLIFEDRREQVEAVVAYLRQGLERREKCIWVVPDAERPAAARALEEAGVDVDVLCESGALELRPVSALEAEVRHAAQGGKPKFLLAALAGALEAGFAGLRTTVEVAHMRWDRTGAGGLFPQEAQVSAFLEQHPCLALCQYDRRQFAPEELLAAIRTHPFILHRGRLWPNFYYLPHEELLRADSRDREVDRLLSIIARRGEVEAALRRTQDELEARVRERTQQLERVNQALQEEMTERTRTLAALRDSGAALQQSGHQLRALAAGLLTALEEERRRLSRELHDDFNQRLAMLAIQVESLQQDLPLTPAAIRPRLSHLREGINALSDDLRHVAYQLHPSTLDHLGLAAALRTYCAELSRRHGLQIRFRRGHLPRTIPQPVALCLYRVAQEALGNAIKHSKSSRIAVVLSRRDGALRLSITDHGAGFDRAAGSRRGLGLISMEERVRLVEGDLTVRSHPGKGTRLEVRIPLAPEVS